MALKYRSTEVFLKPDVRHKSKLVSKFINCMMYGGKKSTAESCFYRALDILEEKTPGVDPLKAFETCLDNVRPDAGSALEARRRRHVPGARRSAPEPRDRAGDPVDSRRGALEEGQADAHQARGGTRGRVQQDGGGVYSAGKRSQDGGSEQSVRALRLVNLPHAADRSPAAPRPPEVLRPGSPPRPCARRLRRAPYLAHS